ncbi:hypothetical protein NQ317_008922 [Molorchus minor]|uniref:Uncharacterized protein n=1 Tax=Molorchus minor TaxID=1323400 RepID=A0ABQ9JS91_9CUCU|nr:hypothetical protein NQ317_008922 [Molorchus minor]
MQLGTGKLQHTSVISVKHADANKPPSLYLAPMALQNYLFWIFDRRSIKPTSFESMLWC